MVDKTFYAALGVSADASADEIKRAYRKMARKYHPDVNNSPDADAKFKAASAAYDVLRDPEKRAAYDRFGLDWDQPREQASAGGDGRWQGGFSFDDSELNADAFRDLFGDRFGANFGGRFGPRFGGAQPQQARIEIPLELAMTGGNQTLTLQVPQIDNTGHVTLETRRVDLKLPKGVLPGQNLRLAGQGTGSGDLLIEVAFRPHPIYHIDGRDLFVTLPITPWEAALGGKIRMPTPTGPVDLNIPENARQGQKMRLRGRGIPAAVKGDLYAILQIVNPPDLSAKARELYQQLARTQSFNPRSKLGV